MKAKRLICIVLSLAAAFSLLLVRDSAAWLNTRTGTAPSGDIIVDKMAFSFDGALGSYLRYPDAGHAEYVVTEQNLIVTNGGKISVTNHSSIETQVRFRITYTTPTESDRVYKGVTTGSDPDSLVAQIADGWTQGGTAQAPDGYFYRDFHLETTSVPVTDAQTGEPVTNAQTGEPETRSVATKNAADADPVDAILKLYYPDELYQRNASGELVTDAQGKAVDLLDAGDYTQFQGEVHVIFEAKQADNVSWTRITSWSTTA